MTKRNKLFTSITLLVGFIFASYLMYYFFFFILLDYGSGDVQSITSFALTKRYYPFYLLVFNAFFFLINFYNLRFRHHKNVKSCKKHYLVSSILLLIISLAAIITTSLKIVDKTFNLNYPGSLLLYYPYEGFVFPIIYIAFSIYYLVVALTDIDVFNNNETKRCNLCISILKSIFYTLFVLIASYYFGIVIFSFKTFPRNSLHPIMSIQTYLISLIPFIMLCLFVYLKMSNKSFKDKVKFQRNSSIIFLLISIIIPCLYYCYELSNPDFLVNELTNIFPLDHMLIKSYAFSIIIITVEIFSSSVVSLINSIAKRRY